MCQHWNLYIYTQKSKAKPFNSDSRKAGSSSGPLKIPPFGGKGPGFLYWNKLSDSLQRTPQHIEAPPNIEGNRIVSYFCAVPFYQSNHLLIQHF